MLTRTSYGNVHLGFLLFFGVFQVAPSSFLLFLNLFFIVNKNERMIIKTLSAGLKKVSFHSKSKEKQCQRMLKLPHNCIHLTH